jgi:exopolysaccharide production protein ExoQ
VLCSLALLVEYTTGPFESLNAMAFFGIVMVMIVRYPKHVLGAVAKYWIYLPFLLFAIGSTFWSDDPDLTLRATVEMAVTFVGGLLIGANVPGWAVIRIIAVGTGILIAMSLPYIPSALSRHQALIGVFGSKNIMAFISHAAFTACVAIIIGDRGRILWRLAAAVLVPISIVTLLLAQSGGGTMSLAISTGVLAAGSFYWLLAPRARPLMLILVAGGGLLLLPFYSVLNTWWAVVQHDVLHKDNTLSGRTYLWSFASRLIEEHPMIGRGFASFWRVGNIDAQGLWTRFRIYNQYGFNFHNTLIEMMVGVGYIGTFLFCLILLFVAIRVVVGFIKDPSGPKLFLLAYYVAWYARLPTEVLIGPFDPQTALLIGAGVLAGERTLKVKRAPFAFRTRTARPARPAPFVRPFALSRRA